MEPENRQITIDEIIDSAEAIVEATLAQIYPPDQRREQHPEEYAITPDSSSRLLAAGRIMSNTIARFPVEYVLDGKTPGGKMVLDQESRGAILTAFRRKRVAQRDTIRLARKVLQGGKWWTVLYYGAQPEGQPGAGGLCYSLVTSEGVTARISPATHPAFYEITPESAESYRAAQREALGLSPEYKYLTAREWETLSNILAVFDDGASKDRELILYAPSAPGLYPTAYLGQAALERYQPKKGAIGETKVKAGDGRDYTIAPPSNGKGAITWFEMQSVNATKLLLLGASRLLKQGIGVSNVVNIPLSEFKEETGITDDKGAREAAKKAILILASMTTMLDQYENGKLIKSFPAGIIRRGAKHSYYSNSNIRLEFEQEYFDYILSGLPEMGISKKIMLLPSRGNEFMFAFHISVDHRRNAGKPGRDHIVSVDKLLSISTFPDPTDPKATTVIRKGQEGQRIITPFMDTFDKLEEKDILTGELWLSAKAAPGRKARALTADETIRAMTDYNFFRSLMIHYYIYGEPEYSEIVAKREEHRARLKAPAKKKRASKPKKKPAQG